MEVIICDLPTIKPACIIFVERAFGEFDLRKDDIEIDSETKSCRIYCDKQIDRAMLEQNLEVNSFAGQHARIGHKDDLPDGVECSGLIVTFKPGRSDDCSPPVAEANPNASPRRLPTDSVIAEIVNTPGKIAFLQKFSTVFSRIHESHGKIEIDANWRKITVNALQQDIDELVEENLCLREKLNPLPPLYQTVAVKHFTSIRDLFENTLAKVPTLSNLQVILCQSREDSVQYFALVAASEQFIQDALPLLEGLFASRDVELEDIHKTVTCSEEWAEALEALSQRYRVSFNQSETVLKIAGVKEDLELCYKEVSRMLDSGPLVKLVVEFQNSEDIYVVWQKLGLGNFEYKDLLSRDEQQCTVTIAGSAKDAQAAERKIVACRDSLVHVDIKDLNPPGLATFLTSQLGQDFLWRFALEADGRPRHCRVFVDKASRKHFMEWRSIQRKVSDKPVEVISEVKCGSKVTIAVVRGNLFNVQTSGVVLIPLTKLGTRHADCSSKLWSTFLGIDKRACETALTAVDGLKATNGWATLTDVTSQHLSYTHVCFACTSAPWSEEQKAQKDLAQVMGSCLSSMDRLGLSTVSIAITSWQELEYTEASVTKIIKTACERYSGDRTLKVYLPVDDGHTAHVVCQSLGIEDLSLAALGKTASDVNLKRMLDMGEVDSSAAPAGVKKPGLVGTLKPVVMASYACIKEDEYGELDEAEAAITAAVDMNREPSFSNGPVIRIVAADQRTADRVETEVRERLDELFTSATVTKPVVKLYNTITREYRSSSASCDVTFLRGYGRELHNTGALQQKMITDYWVAMSPAPVLVRDLTTTPLYKALMTGEQGLLDMLADRDIPYPNSWSTNPGRRPVDVTSPFVHRSPCLPGSAEFEAVNQLVQATWKQDFVGTGADAHDLTHKSITVTKVERIENGELFKKYIEFRRNFCKMLCDDGVTFPSIKDSDNGLDVETSAIETSALDWWDREGHVKYCLLPQINEVLLFHGTKPDVYEAIVREGFDCRLNQRSMFGNGTYLTESSTKADQYADAINARQPTGDKYMIIARVILGHPYVCTKPQPFCRPPCVEPKCNRLDMCVAGHKRSHSVIGVNGNNGQRLPFREFIVYDFSQCYPLYLVTYNRVTTEQLVQAKVTENKKNIPNFEDFHRILVKLQARMKRKSPVTCQMSESKLPRTELQQTMCSQSIDPVFNQKTPRDWEHVEDDFTSLGGELSHWASDNALLVTRGAIPVGETWHIRGKIHTLLDQFVESLRQCDNYRDIFPSDAWRFCSSVAEFKITSVSDKGQDMPMSELVGREFLKPVTINIRHTAACEHSRRHLRVFCVQDNNLIQEIKAPNIDDPNCAIPFFEVNESFLTIKTTHFSFYFACICDEQVVNVNMRSINAIVYGRIYEEADGDCRYKAEIDCAFEFLPEESVSRLPEFWQGYVANKRDEGKTQRLRREVTFPSEYLNCSTDMHVTLTLSSPGWAINLRMCDREKIFKFADIFQCNTRMHMQCKYKEKYFALNGEQDSISAAVSVTLHLNGQNQRSCLEPLGFNLKIKEKQDSPRLTTPSADSGSFATVGGVSSGRDNTAISKQSLHVIARSIAPSDILPLAVELNYDLSDVRQFQSNHQHDSRRSTMDMLDRWCDEKMGDEQMVLEKVIEMLFQKLKAVKCFDAACKLQGIAGRAIAPKDLMVLAKAIPPDNYLTLGLGLQLTYTDLKCVKTDNPNDILGAMFCMLDLWCKTALIDGQPLHSMVNILSEALYAEGLTNVAQMLDGYADD